VDNVAQGHGNAAFFFLQCVDGKAISNNFDQTKFDANGRGPAGPGTPQHSYVRSVPTTKATFTIVGQTWAVNRTWATVPTLMANRQIYVVSGDVTFTPQPGHTYSVKGVLGSQASAVWIEDQTGSIVGQMIEKQHAGADVFQK
jgi:hypothetical protein